VERLVQWLRLKRKKAPKEKQICSRPSRSARPDKGKAMTHGTMAVGGGRVLLLVGRLLLFIYPMDSHLHPQASSRNRGIPQGQGRQHLSHRPLAPISTSFLPT